MPTAYVQKIANEKGMSIADAEAKWSDAKKAVDKSKYNDDDTYWKVVMTVFKKMVGENYTPGTILNFENYIFEILGFSRSEKDANRHLASVDHNTSHIHSVQYNNPGAHVDKKTEQRKMEVHGAAMKHVRQGDHKAAFAAAYKIAHGHAKEDFHSNAPAHEIATRRAKHAVKTAQDAMRR